MQPFYSVAYLNVGVGEREAASNLNAERIHEIKEDTDLVTQCGKVGICVIALLDPQADSFPKDTEVLQQLFMKRRSDPLGFVWVEAPPRTALMGGFSVVRSELPTVVALSRSKMRFGVLREQLTLSNTDTFLNGILNGRISTMALQVSSCCFLCFSGCMHIAILFFTSL